MMHEYESQEREIVDFIVLMWPPLGEQGNCDASRSKYNGVKTILVPDDEWSLQDSHGEDVENE